MTITYFNRFADGDDMGSLDVSFAAQLRSQRDKLVENLQNAAAAQYNITPEPYGGFRRVVAATFASTGTKVFTIDDEMDWRDRMLFIVGPSSVSATQLLYPGNPQDAAINLGSAVGLVALACYYTGSGYADPGGVAGNNYHKLYSISDVQLYAHTSGDLRLELRVATTIALNVQIYVSPKMGARGSSVGKTYVTTSTLYDAADGNKIEPHDLNNLQDAVHVGQVKGADTIALGPVGRGDPKLPYEWTVRGATKRQRLLEPALRRYVSFTSAIDTLTLLDDSFDWRDRFVWAGGMFSITVDRRPGETNDPGNGTFSTTDAEGTYMAGYTGSGDAGGDYTSPSDLRYTLRQLGTLPTTPFFLYADEDTGHLYASTFDPTGSNENDVVASCNLVICASPRIGPRSKGTDPDILEDPLPGKKISGVLVDSASSDLTDIVARYRMDRGIVLDGGKVAVIADVSGNGHHLRQLDPSLRATSPRTRSALNSAVCIGTTGTEYYESVKKFPASTAGYHIGVICEPLLTLADFEMWRLQLPLSTEGQISGPISGNIVDAQWVPNQTATPPYLERDPSGTYISGVGIGLEWDFSPSSGRLVPDVTTRKVGGSPSTSFTVTTSPVGGADVQSLVWRLFEGFHGYIAEVIICDAGQASVDDFITSTDIVSRYGF